MMKRAIKALEFSKRKQDAILEKSLNRYTYKLIKVIGVVAAIMGLIILGAFWFWVIKQLYKIEN